MGTSFSKWLGGPVGGGPVKGSMSKIMNWIVSCDTRDWFLVADPRHAELVIEQLGVSEFISTATPGIDGQDEVDREDDVDIVGADATRFRGFTTRYNYLVFQRLYIQLSTEEICGGISKPTTGSLPRVAAVGPALEVRAALGLEVRDAGTFL